MFVLLEQRIVMAGDAEITRHGREVLFSRNTSHGHVNKANQAAVRILTVMAFAQNFLFFIFLIL